MAKAIAKGNATIPTIIPQQYLLKAAFADAVFKQQKTWDKFLVLICLSFLLMGCFSI